MFELGLPLHECADPAAAESAAEPLHSVAAKPLQSIADSAVVGAVLNETS
jgi:hypothetical protein